MSTAAAPLVPPGTIRLWKPSDYTVTSNLCGFHDALREKGWDRAMREGLWGEPSVDDVIEAGYPSLWVMWATGEWPRGSTIPRSGIYPPTGTAVQCTPRGPEHGALAESIVPGFWSAMAPRIARCHALGGRVFVNTGTPSVTSFGLSISRERREAILDSWIKPGVDAGMGPRDAFVGDASGATSQKNKTHGMHWAERCLFHNVGFVIEPHERIHPELYPWCNQRFGAVSPHYADPKHSRWGAILGSDRNWFAPGMNWAIKEHFCFLQGGSEQVEGQPPKPLSDRLLLIPPRDVNGSPVSTVLEMGDLPREWLGLGPVIGAPA